MNNHHNKQITKNQKNNQPGIISATFVGPVPPPNILQGYKDIDPNFPDRIIRMAEEEGKHRREIEKELVAQRAYGQKCGLVVALVGLIGCVITAYWGHEIAASVLGGATLASLVSVFVAGRIKQKEASGGS